MTKKKKQFVMKKKKKNEEFVRNCSGQVFYTEISSTLAIVDCHL